MTQVMGEEVTAFTASNAEEIYKRFAGIDTAESETAELGKEMDQCYTYFENTGIDHFRKKLKFQCGKENWIPIQPHQNEFGTWTRGRLTDFQVIPDIKPDFRIRPFQDNISDRPFDSSTSDDYFPRENLSRIIQTVFEVGRYEQFEDGMISDFSIAIENILKYFQDRAIELLSDFLSSNKIDSDLICETLRTLGRIQDAETEQIRLQILIPYLSNSSPYIRDCTGIALYDLASPNAIPYIRKAIDKEPYQILKDDLNKVYNELQELESGQVDSAT